MAGILRDAALNALAAWEALPVIVDSHDDAGLLSPQLVNDFGAVQSAMAGLRRLLPAPPRDYDPRPYIAANHWVFARTMPDNPHEYLVIRKSTDPYEHLMFPEWIRAVGDIEHVRALTRLIVESGPPRSELCSAYRPDLHWLPSWTAGQGRAERRCLRRR
jgi:hypothetical protein